MYPFVEPRAKPDVEKKGGMKWDTVDDVIDR